MFNFLALLESFWSLITIVASDWPRTFLQPGCFCLAYIYMTVSRKLTYHNRTYKSTDEFSRPFICTTHEFSQTFIRCYKRTTHVCNFFVRICASTPPRCP